jgi:hypothetical protein
LPPLPPTSTIVFTEFVVPSLFDPFIHDSLITWQPSSFPCLLCSLYPSQSLHMTCFTLGGSLALNGSQGPHKHRAAWTVHPGRGRVAEYDCIQTQGQSRWQFSGTTAFPVSGWAHHQGLSGMSLVQYPCSLVCCNMRCIWNFLFGA